MEGFTAALARGRQRQTGEERARAPLAPVGAAMAEWFAEPTFRGCAFINSVAEIGGALPETCDIARRHKAEMTAAIRALVAERPDAEDIAGAASLAVDGAIVRAQQGPGAVAGALADLDFALAAMARVSPDPPAAEAPRR